MVCAMETINKYQKALDDIRYHLEFGDDYNEESVYVLQELIDFVTECEELLPENLRQLKKGLETIKKKKDKK